MNAKNEFIEETKDKAPVLCADIKYGYYYESHIDKPVFMRLKIGYKPSDMDEFLNKLDFEYDEDFGTQELFGTIWLEDGTWFTRGEYDGSEWWSYKKLPSIPEYLQ